MENATECTLKALISYIENEGKMTEKEKLSARQRLQLLS